MINAIDKLEKVLLKTLEDLEELKVKCDCTNDKCWKLKNENIKLRKALEFYANEENYYRCDRTPNTTSPVSDGCGKLARKTLKETSKGIKWINY